MTDIVMSSKNIQQTKQVSVGSYILLFIVVGLFAYIVQKNVSLPQSVIRPLGVMALTVLFASIFYKPIYAFLVLVAYIPFSRILVGGFDTGATGFNLTNVLIFIALIGWIMDASSRRRRLFERSALTAPVALFIAWGMLSLIKSTATYGAEYLDNFIIPLKRWLTPIILYFLALNMIRDKPALKKVIIAMMIVMAIVGLMASVDYLNVRDAGNLDKSRVGGVFEQPNTLGGFFVYNMFLFLGFFFTYFPHLASVMLIVPFLICFRGIMVTFSRGAYLGAAAGGIATAFFKSRFLFAICIFMLIFMILNPSLLPAGIRYRMNETYGDEGTVISTDLDSITDRSATKRLDIWKGALAIINEYPVFGIGYGLFPFFISRYTTVGEADAHNTYLILAAEMGIPSLVIFLIIILLMTTNSIWLYWKSKDKFIRAFALGMLGNLFGLIVVNMFGSRLNSEEVGAYFWIYAGLIMATVAMKKRGEIA